NTERYESNPHFKNSEASFLRMPHVLLILGAKAVLQPDLSMTIDGEDMLVAAKTLKLPATALSSLLAKLKDYGFEINGLGKSVKSDDVITLSYIDCRALTAVLKAMAEALLEMNKGDIKKPKHLFYLMHPGILENKVVKEPKWTVETVLRVMEPTDWEHAAALHAHVADTTKQVIKGNGNGICCNIWTCTYTGIKNKKVLMSLHVDQEYFSVKLNLYHISKYMDLVAELPEKMREAIRSCGWGCGDCNSRCAGGFVFEMDGTAYNKCRCGSFVFGSLTAEDIESCQKLLTAELSC
ncbi:MAG: hypothetical protein FWD03_09200, partial [Defluviitaleaceae bacterium]|nr:hypothetical protein [Defluviitaleaceae bacterium]